MTLLVMGIGVICSVQVVMLIINGFQKDDLKKVKVCFQLDPYALLPAAVRCYVILFFILKYQP